MFNVVCCKCPWTMYDFIRNLMLCRCRLRYVLNLRRVRGKLSIPNPSSAKKCNYIIVICFNQWKYYFQSIYRVGQMSVRQFANAPKKNEIHPGYFKLKEIQKLYQVSEWNYFMVIRKTYLILVSLCCFVHRKTMVCQFIWSEVPSTKRCIIPFGDWLESVSLVALNFSTRCPKCAALWLIRENSRNWIYFPRKNMGKINVWEKNFRFVFFS